MILSYNNNFSRPFWNILLANHTLDLKIIHKLTLFTAYHDVSYSNFLVESQYEISTILLENLVVDKMY